jgi:hypothetical protein
MNSEKRLNDQKSCFVSNTSIRRTARAVTSQRIPWRNSRTLLMDHDGRRITPSRPARGPSRGRVPPSRWRVHGIETLWVRLIRRAVRCSPTWESQHGS